MINKVVISNKNGDYMEELFTKYLPVIQSDHAYIHKGLAFTYLGTTGSLSAGASTSIEFTTPSVGSGKFVHFRPTFISSSANYLTMSLNEASTTTGGGSVLTDIKNRNRNSTTASAFQTLKTAVTVSVAGTQIDTLATGVAGGGSNNSGGQGGGAQEELLLIPNTKYTMTFTNAGTVTATIGIYKLFWYEESMG